MRKTALVAAASLLIATAVHAADPIKAFPPAEEGMVRHAIELPKQGDEALFKVEILVGKTVETDDRNRYFFGGAIAAETVKGWGYTRYVVEKLGPMAGTRIAVPPDAPKVKRFVSLGGEPYLIRYNSRLPIVVYVPEDAEVFCRIWKAADELKPIPKG